MATRNVDAVLFDLLMAVMNSLAVWSSAAWRDEVTSRMGASESYVAYERLVADAAADLGIQDDRVAKLFERWRDMEPWPDASAVARLTLPYAFVTNCSRALAETAAERSRLAPRFVLSAEEAGWYKPDARIYREACARLGSRPERTLFVAGSPYDADGAAAAGLRAVLVARRPGDRPGRGDVPVAHSLDDVLNRFVS